MIDQTAIPDSFNSTAHEARHRFQTGAVRSSDADDTRYDLISPIALRELSKTCAEGAAKYGDHNWLKGMPYSSFLNHCLRHLVMYQIGDRSEPHLAHAFWNIMAMIHMTETRPELNDIPNWGGHCPAPARNEPPAPDWKELEDPSLL